MWCHNACFHHNARLTSWRTLMAHFVLSPNGEESLNQFLSPDPDPHPDHLRGGPSHGHNTNGVTKIKSIGAIVFELRIRKDVQTYIQTDTNALPSHSSPGERIIIYADFFMFKPANVSVFSN